jgi:hypothetical protein
MKRLTEVGLKCNTDKAYGHGFTEVYDDFFSKFKSPRILEIGVYNGGSMEMYNQYYDYSCEIIGIDNGEQLSYKPSHKNISILIADQSKPEELFSRVDGNFDIIVDDGSHFVEHQINCFNLLYKKLNPGGIYIIEDLHCCYHPFYNPNNVKNTIDFLNTIEKDFYNIKNVSIFSNKPLEEADNLSSITSVIEF